MGERETLVAAWKPATRAHVTSAPSRCLLACRGQRERDGQRAGGRGSRARSADGTSSGHGEPGAWRLALPLARCVTWSKCGRGFGVPARSPRVPFAGAVIPPLSASRALLLRVYSDGQMVGYGSPARSRDGTKAKGAGEDPSGWAARGPVLSPPWAEWPRL